MIVMSHRCKDHNVSSWNEDYWPFFCKACLTGSERDLVNLLADQYKEKKELTEQVSTLKEQLGIAK